MRVVLDPEARTEFLEAAAWYARRSRRSAVGFIADFKELEPGVGRLALLKEPT